LNPGNFKRGNEHITAKSKKGATIISSNFILGGVDATLGHKTIEHYVQADIGSSMA
jgi:hypothetical protein